MVLAFWSMSCVPCLEELPELEKLRQQQSDNGLTVLPICVDAASIGEVHEFMRDRLQDLPVYTSADGLARARYDVQVLPTAFLIDPDGRLVGSLKGSGLTASKIASAVK